MNVWVIFGTKGQNLKDLLILRQFLDFKKRFLSKEPKISLSYDHILENNVAFCVSDDVVLGFLNYELRPNGLFIFLICVRKDMQKEVIVEKNRTIGRILIEECVKKHNTRNIFYSSTSPDAERFILRNREFVDSRQISLHNVSKHV